MLEQNPQNVEMEIGTESCNITEWKMAEKAAEWKPDLRFKT